MLCENCKSRQATYHYKTITNGKIREQHLCRECAEKLNYSANGGLTDLLSGFFSPSVSHRMRVCPVCGMTESEVSKTGLVGCEECYKTFAALLDPYIRRVHGSDRHIGLTPGNVDQIQNGNSDSIEDLKIKMQEAVNVQNYELAAELRDRIKELEGGDAE